MFWAVNSGGDIRAIGEVYSGIGIDHLISLQNLHFGKPMPSLRFLPDPDYNPQFLDLSEILLESMQNPHRQAKFSPDHFQGRIRFTEQLPGESQVRYKVQKVSQSGKSLPGQL